MKRRAGLLVCVAVAVLAVGGPVRAATPVIEHGVLRSFDGTPIAWTFFSRDSDPGRRSPVVFYTHGWAGTRARTATGLVRTLLDQGYAVLTWDARGFGDSGGEANVDSQEYEVRDVRALIDMVAARDDVQLDAGGDPRMGMVGGSYAGGIQLMTASADPRVDALVPEIAWNDLVRSLKPNGVLKIGWGTLLYGAGAGTGTSEGLDSPAGPQTASLAPEIHRAFVQGVTVNDWTEDIEAWFAARSPARYIGGPGAMPGVRVPTLLIQGTIDTLFTPLEAVRNAQQIAAGRAPVKMMFFCGGHTFTAGSSCIVDPEGGPTQSSVIRGAMLRWLDRYVRDPLDDVSTGAPVEYQLQDGTWRTARALPHPTGSATVKARLANPVAPTSGSGTGATPAPDAARAPFDLRAGTIVAGIPRATVRVSGTGVEGALFLKLVDRAPDGSMRVVDDQVTALKVEPITSEPRTYTIDLAGAFWRLEEGHQLLLEVSTTSNDHNSARVPGVMNVEATVSLPIAAGGARANASDRPGGARVLGTSADRGTLPRTGTAGSTWAALVMLLLATAVVWMLRGRAAGGRS